MKSDAFQITAACTSCEDCVAVCPTGSIFYAMGQYAIDPDTCNACGICARVCPVDAIFPVTFEDVDLARVSASDKVPSEEEE